MIIVLCILMLFLVFSVSVMAAAAAVLGTSKRTAVSERCKTAAASFSGMLEEQLVQERESVPLNLQAFFSEMVREKMRASQPVHAGFFWDGDSEEGEIPAELIHEITVTNGGRELKDILHGYQISVEAVWTGNTAQFQKAYEENNREDLTEAQRLPQECCYNGIGLQVTTICENEKMRESYRMTVRYHVWIEGTPGAETAKVWKFTTDGRETS